MKNDAFRFIKQFIAKNGYSPTFREVAKGIGIKSTSTIFSHLNQLSGYGLIRYQSFKPRTIVVLKDMPE